MAHNCHGNNKYLTVEPKCHGEIKFPTAKPKCLLMKAKVQQLPLENGDLKIKGKIYKRAKYDGILTIKLMFEKNICHHF